MILIVAYGNVSFVRNLKLACYNTDFQGKFISRKFT